MHEAYYDFELEADPTIDPNRKACLDEDPEVFFPPSTNKELIGVAKKVCQSCPVIDACLEEYLDMEWGVVGGMSEQERRALRRRRPFNRRSPI